MLVSRLHCGTSKTMHLPLFWKSHCATCSPECVILYHVTGPIILFMSTTLNCLGFGVTATGHLHFWNNEMKDMLVYQSDPVGVELLSYVNTFVGFMLHCLCTKASKVKLHISSFDLHVIQRKQLIGFCRREEGTHHIAKLQLSVCMKSRTHFVYIFMHFMYRHVCNVFKMSLTLTSNFKY